MMQWEEGTQRRVNLSRWELEDSDDYELNSMREREDANNVISKNGRE